MEGHSENRLTASLQDVIRKQARSYGVTPGQPYALIDFPNHSNVGDSAIWLGELVHLQDVVGLPPAFVSTYDNFDAEALRKTLPTGPIFLHGGGNFGDLWPQHQQFRESIIRRFPERRIIQLAQSIHYDDPHRVESAAAAINQHPDFLLFVRDRESKRFAEASFRCPVYIAPDSAFCIGPMQRPVTPRWNLLLLLRTDKERNDIGNVPPLPDGAVVLDWLDEDANVYRDERRRAALQSLFTNGLKAFDKAKSRPIYYRNVAQNRLDRGAALLSSAHYVITDRLHVHILCLLLGIPHSVIDNSYGKLSRFISLWTNGCDLFQVAASLDEALQQFQQRAAAAHVLKKLSATVTELAGEETKARAEDPHSRIVGVS
jgi:pyruvyl transferase EpsO